jgi:hypothetical protein
MRPQRRYWISSRSVAALILLGMIACAASGCGPDYGYSGYPGYGYAPYSYGWGDRYYYNPDFNVHHSWEDHWGGGGHHTEFYHGGGGSFVGHEGGGGFHGGGGGGFHGGGGGGGHGGGGGGHR